MSSEYVHTYYFLKESHHFEICKPSLETPSFVAPSRRFAILHLVHPVAYGPAVIVAVLVETFASRSFPKAPSSWLPVSGWLVLSASVTFLVLGPGPRPASLDRCPRRMMLTLVPVVVAVKNRFVALGGVSPAHTLPAA